MPYFMGDVEIHCQTTRTKLVSYLLKSDPEIVLYVDGSPHYSNQLADSGFSLYYQTVGREKRLRTFLYGSPFRQLPRGASPYAIGTSFILLLDPEPKFDTVLHWKMQLMGRTGSKPIRIEGELGKPV